VLPLQFLPGTDRKTLKLMGTERFDLVGLSNGLQPRQTLTLRVWRADGSDLSVSLLSRIDTADELDYFQNGGILPYVLRNLLES